jgi:hypothetical protein
LHPDLGNGSDDDAVEGTARSKQIATTTVVKNVAGDPLCLTPTARGDGILFPTTAATRSTCFTPDAQRSIRSPLGR